MKKYLNKIRMAAFAAVLTAATILPSAAVNAAQDTEPFSEQTFSAVTETDTDDAVTAAENNVKPLASQTSSDTSTSAGGELQHYFFDNALVNTGLDTGYKEKNSITKEDPHFGWTLGKFNVTGYTRITNEDTDNPVFLKTVGDKVTLWFKLEQDINKLGGNEDLKIASDSNGSDEYFGIKETNFKKGTLIVRHSDYQNKNQTPVIYKDYLNSKVNKGQDTTVELFEEGDYEVALDYEVERHSKFLLIPKTEYFNYRMFFKFSVRNGNCMVYPFDVKTNEELSNSSVTENGFRLDLAKSRYLDIDIKKEILKEGADGLTEDVRFNSPAKDGAKYTSEGIYTITVSNRYTDQQTEKKIYVGTNNLLKAHITTGLSVSEIKRRVEAGAEINDDGTIVTVIKKSEVVPEKITVDEKAVAAKSVPQTVSLSKAPDIVKESSNSNNDHTLLFVIAAAAAGVIIMGTVVGVMYLKSRKENK